MPEESLTEEWQKSLEERSARERVYDVALQLHEPTKVSDVAERAEVSKETARNYLTWFTEIGILTQDSRSPDTFSRNDSYFEWKRINELRSLPKDELTSRLEELTQKETEYRNKYEEESPSEVEALDYADYDEVEEVWLELDEWETVRRRIRELEKARNRSEPRDGVSA
ncbi:ArsR family transcriptional regulator [Halorutilales archaeon Cl-col2-1]